MENENKKDKKQKSNSSNTPSFFKEMDSFIKPFSNQYALSVVISILSVLFNLASYVFAGIVIAFLFGEGATTSFYLLFIAMTIVSKLLSAVLRNFSTWVSHKAAYKTLREIRMALIQKFKKLPLGYFENKGSGRLNAVIVDKIEGMEVTLAHVLPELTANLLCPALLMVWMFFIDWRIALCVLIWIIIGFSLSGGMFVGYEETYKNQIKAFKGMNQGVVEYVGGIEVIKNFGQEDKCYKKFTDSVYNHANFNIKWRSETQKYASAGMCMSPYPVFPVLIFGLIFFSKGTIDVSTLFLLIIQSLGIFQPLMQAMSYFDQMAQMGTNAKEIKDILNYKENKRGVETKFDSFDIEYKNVSFSYKDEDDDESEGDKKVVNALNNVSFDIKEGQMLALVGPSGSGKSTIAKLLAGYFDADSGEILIGNKSISLYSSEALNKEIAYVDQDSFLFNKSIMDNIRMGCPDATDEEIKQICKKAGCDSFIENLPDKYQTLVGECGNRLSGGERQRLCIARAMAKDASIMILDEATSSSDPENEDLIQRSLSASCKGKTLIVVAHRLKTIVNADKIAFVKDGCITQLGTHKELLEKSADYKVMWEESFMDDENNKMEAL